MNKNITKFFITMCALPIISVPFAPINASADSLPLSCSADTSLKSITKGFLGVLDSQNPLAPGLTLTSPDFVPNYITIDIYNGGPQDLSWYMAVGNATTNTVITPNLAYQPGVTRMKIRLDGVTKGDELVFFMRATSGRGEVHLRATLSND